MLKFLPKKLKKYESPGINKILEQVIQAGGNALHSGVHKLIILFGIGRTATAMDRIYRCAYL
jgi:hypothetical protein